MKLVIQGEKEEIVLSGESFSISNPYNLPNSKYWQVSIKPKLPHVKNKYVITFVNRIRAEVFRKGNVNVIKFYKFTVVEDKNVSVLFMPSQKDMDLYIEQNTVKIDDKSKESLVKELFGNELTEKELFGEDIGTDMNIDEMLQAWEDFYEDKSSDATSKAKELLASISNHYLTKDLLSKDTYIRSKLLIQAESLSMLFVQLNLTKQVLLKFFREIMSDIGNKTIIEGFNQQQRFVLEINSFINTTIQNIIDDMKQANIREKERLEEEERERIQDIGHEEVNKNSLVTRDKTKLLNEIGDVLLELKLEEDIDENYVEEIRKKKMKDLNIKEDD